MHPRKEGYGSTRGPVPSTSSLQVAAHGYGSNTNRKYSANSALTNNKVLQNAGSNVSIHQDSGGGNEFYKVKATELNNQKRNLKKEILHDLKVYSSSLWRFKLRKDYLLQRQWTLMNELKGLYERLVQFEEEGKGTTTATITPNVVGSVGRLITPQLQQDLQSNLTLVIRKGKRAQESLKKWLMRQKPTGAPPNNGGATDEIKKTIGEIVDELLTSLNKKWSEFTTLVNCREKFLQIEENLGMTREDIISKECQGTDLVGSNEDLEIFIDQFRNKYPTQFPFIDKLVRLEVDAERGAKTFDELVEKLKTLEVSRHENEIKIKESFDVEEKLVQELADLQEMMDRLNDDQNDPELMKTHHFFNEALDDSGLLVFEELRRAFEFPRVQINIRTDSPVGNFIDPEKETPGSHGFQGTPSQVSADEELLMKRYQLLCSEDFKSMLEGGISGGHQNSGSGGKKEAQSQVKGLNEGNEHSLSGVGGDIEKPTGLYWKQTIPDNGIIFDIFTKMKRCLMRGGEDFKRLEQAFCRYFNRKIQLRGEWSDISKKYAIRSKELDECRSSVKGMEERNNLMEFEREELERQVSKVKTKGEEVVMERERILKQLHEIIREEAEAMNSRYQLVGSSKSRNVVDKFIAENNEHFNKFYKEVRRAYDTIEWNNTVREKNKCLLADELHVKANEFLTDRIEIVGKIQFHLTTLQNLIKSDGNLALSLRHYLSGIGCMIHNATSTAGFGSTKGTGGFYSTSNKENTVSSTSGYSSGPIQGNPAGGHTMLINKSTDQLLELLAANEMFNGHLTTILYGKASDEAFDEGERHNINGRIIQIEFELSNVLEREIESLHKNESNLLTLKNDIRTKKRTFNEIVVVLNELRARLGSAYVVAVPNEASFDFDCESIDDLMAEASKEYISRKLSEMFTTTTLAGKSARLSNCGSFTNGRLNNHPKFGRIVIDIVDEHQEMTPTKEDDEEDSAYKSSQKDRKSSIQRSNTKSKSPYSLQKPPRNLPSGNKYSNNLDDGNSFTNDVSSTKRLTGGLQQFQNNPDDLTKEKDGKNKGRSYSMSLNSMLNPAMPTNRNETHRKKNSMIREYSKEINSNSLYEIEVSRNNRSGYLPGVKDSPASFSTRKHLGAGSYFPPPPPSSNHRNNDRRQSPPQPENDPNGNYWLCSFNTIEYPQKDVNQSNSMPGDPLGSQTFQNDNLILKSSFERLKEGLVIYKRFAIDKGHFITKTNVFNPLATNGRANNPEACGYGKRFMKYNEERHEIEFHKINQNISGATHRRNLIIEQRYPTNVVERLFIPANSQLILRAHEEAKYGKERMDQEKYLSVDMIPYSLDITNVGRVDCISLQHDDMLVIYNAFIVILTQLVAAPN